MESPNVNSVPLLHIILRRLFSRLLHFCFSVLNQRDSRLKVHFKGNRTFSWMGLLSNESSLPDSGRKEFWFCLIEVSAIFSFADHPDIFEPSDSVSLHGFCSFVLLVDFCIDFQHVASWYSEFLGVRSEISVRHLPSKFKQFLLRYSVIPHRFLFFLLANWIEILTKFCRSFPNPWTFWI